MSVPGDPPRAGQTFTKSDRLLRRREFLAVQANGRKLHAAHFLLILRDRGDGKPCRLGLTTSRKVGSAVVRNRVRRLVREVFRLHRESFPSGYDCLVIARENAPDLNFALVRDEVIPLLERRSGRAPAGASPRGGAKPPASQARRP